MEKLFTFKVTHRGAGRMAELLKKLSSMYFYRGEWEKCERLAQYCKNRKYYHTYKRRLIHSIRNAKLLDIDVCGYCVPLYINVGDYPGDSL